MYIYIYLFVVTRLYKDARSTYHRIMILIMCIEICV